TASIVLEGDAGVPNEDEEVTIADGSTLFGGFVRSARVRGWTDTSDEVFVDVDLDGWERVCDWCSITVSYTSTVAVEDVWEDIVTVLSVYGITYSKVVTGVELEPFDFDGPVIDLVRELRGRTPLIYRFNPD